MERITAKDLQRTLVRWLECLGVAPEDRASYSIERWAPGDGVARYKVVRAGHHDVCPYYSLGRRAMYDWLWAGIYMMEERGRLGEAKAAARA